MSVRIIVCGACGKMGGNVLSLLENDPEAVAVCGVDLYPREIGIPVYKSFAEIKEEADVIIDFSSPLGLTRRGSPPRILKRWTSIPNRWRSLKRRIYRLA